MRNLDLEFLTRVRFGVGALAPTDAHGTGLGLRAKLGQVCSLDVAVGFPLERQVNNEEMAGSRVRMSMTANF